MRALSATAVRRCRRPLATAVAGAETLRRTFLPGVALRPGGTPGSPVPPPPTTNPKALPLRGVHHETGRRCLPLTLRRRRIRVRSPRLPPLSFVIPTFRMKLLSERPSVIVRDWVRTASVHTHASARRGSVPYGSFASAVALRVSVYGPFFRMYCVRLPGSVLGSVHRASSRIMKPVSGSSSRSATRASIWSRRSK